MIRSVSIPEYLERSGWAARLLGIEAFSKERNLSQIDSEYDADKYGALLKTKFQNVEAAKLAEFSNAGVGADSPVFMSWGDEIFEMPLRRARLLVRLSVKESVERWADILKASAICELGCGYGFNLSYFDGLPAYGGEYSPNAVTLGKSLGLDVSGFNYYELPDYSLIRPGSLVFTCHSIEQLPDAGAVLAGLRSVKDRIAGVVHFEPTVVPERRTVLGLARNRYMELNDYNRNLLALISADSSIEVLERKTDWADHGMNPLNSTNLVVWRFR